MPGCSAPRCGNNSSQKYDENEEKPTFHHFPAYPERRQQWTQILRDQGKKPRRNNKNPEESPTEWIPNYTNASICSDHFEERFIIKPLTNRPCRSMTTLTEDAIPTLFGEAANKNRKKIPSTKGTTNNNKKRKISENDDELASTTTCDTEQMDYNTDMGEIQDEIGNAAEEQIINPVVDQDVPIEVALHLQMENLNVTPADTITNQNIEWFEDIINTVQKDIQPNNSEGKIEKNFEVLDGITSESVNCSDGEIVATVDSKGKVVTLPIGKNQILGLSVLSKLGGNITSVNKNDGPNPTVHFRVMTADGSFAMFRAKVEATEIASTGSTSPFINDNETPNIAVDSISAQVEDLVKKYKENSLNSEELEKLQGVAKALNVEGKMVKFGD